MYTDRDRDRWTRTYRIDKIRREERAVVVTGDSHKGTYIANDEFQEDKEDMIMKRR